MEPVTISRLKEIQSGVVRGHIVGSVSKVILYDSSDKIELILFGEIPLKPRCTYEIVVKELLLDGCIPVRSADHVTLLSDESETWKKPLSSPYSGPPYKKHLRSSQSNDTRECVFFVREKCIRIKKSVFFVNTFLFVKAEVLEMYIHSLKAEWFLYLIPGRYYHIEFERAFRLDKESSIVDLTAIRGDVSINIIPENGDQFCNPLQRIAAHTLFNREQGKLFNFLDVKSICDLYTIINIEAEILGLDSFERSGFISFVDSQNNFENIAFTPARRTLPRFFVPGSRVLMTQLLVKTVQNKDKRFLSVTHMTQIYLLSLPNSSLSLQNIASLSEVQPTKRTGVVSLIVSVDCILSLTINTINNISCKLCVCDNGDTATLHIRDNLRFVREVFALSRGDEDMLRNVRMECGRVDNTTQGQVVAVFTRILRSGKRFYVKGDVRHDDIEYLVQTAHGRLPKSPRVHIFPYVLRSITAKEELEALQF